MPAGESSEAATAKTASKPAAVEATSKAPTVETTAAEPASMPASTTTSPAPRVNGGWPHQADAGNQSHCDEKTLCSF
jgi:hypothetical protein